MMESSDINFKQLRIDEKTIELMKEYKKNSQTYSDFINWMLYTIFGPRLEYVDYEPCIHDVDDLIRKEMNNDEDSGNTTPSIKKGYTCYAETNPYCSCYFCAVERKCQEIYFE